MAITQSKRNMPTVTQAVELFVSKNRAQRGVREHISGLQGARSGRVVGKKAAGTAIAKSPLGQLRFDRVSGDEFATWFHDRHPGQLAASTRKRGRSSLRQLLLYAIARRAIVGDLEGITGGHDDQTLRTVATCERRDA